MRGRLNNIKKTLRTAYFAGNKYFCPLCEKSFRKFMKVGEPPRQNAMCPGCFSLERHRLLWLYLLREWHEGRLAHAGRLLHVAPEAVLEQKFRASFDYLSIDLDGQRAMQAMDLTCLDLENASFDVIICNHVLEHVVDDRRALIELYRVLKPGGWGAVNVPISGEYTIEDERVTNLADRRKLYGNADHVRQYGRDFILRLRETGFMVQEIGRLHVGSVERLRHCAVADQEPLIFVGK